MTSNHHKLGSKEIMNSEDSKESRNHDYFLENTLFTTENIEERKKSVVQKTKFKLHYATSRRINVRNCSSLILIIVVAFSIISCVRAVPQEHYKITHLSASQPLYFDSIGNIQLIHDEWKLLVYYNLTTFWQSTEKVEQCVNHLAKVCHALPNNTCHSTVKQLMYEITQLNEYNVLLMSQQQNRKRRGFINGVGNLARSLFGILDSNFADKYSQDIQNIRRNENYARELIRNQTLIIEAENNIIKKNENFVSTQLDIIEKYMTTHREQLMHNNYLNLKTMADVNSGALTATLLLTVLRRNQQMLLNALTDIYRGNLDMKLFTPEQLTEQLNFIAGIISKKLTLPIEINNGANIQDIYKLIYVRARLTKQYLLFELHIPLLSDDDYSLYRNIPIPKPNAMGQCQKVAVSSKYIGVNFMKNSYIQIDEIDLRQCTKMITENYVCRAYMPVRNLQSTKAVCEAKLLSQNLKNIKCDWVQHQCSDQWTKLQRPNIWLYNCINECETKIVCDNKITTTVIKKAGLLALGQDCVLQNNDATIYSHNVLSSETDIGLVLEVPTIDSANDIDWGVFNKSLIIIPRQNLSEEHRLLDKQIVEQKERENVTIELSSHDIANYTLSSLLGGVIVIAFVLWCMRKGFPACLLCDYCPRPSMLSKRNIGTTYRI